VGKSPRRARAITLVLSLVVAGCGPVTQSAPPGGGSGGGGGTGSSGGGTGTGDLIAATVRVSVEGVRDGRRTGWSGSGTVISDDGLIVTNAHVAAPHALGLAIQYRQPAVRDAPDTITIEFTEAEDEVPVPRYTASVLAADGYLDAAILRIDRTTDGAAVDPDDLDLPFVRVGDSDALRIGDPLRVVGYPGIGGPTISVSSGDVSGFVEDDHIGSRGWIKTSAIVHSGNSGGLAANAAGELVGIPTRAPDFKDPNDIGGYELLRPISLVQPLIDAARQGEGTMTSRYILDATGREEFSFAWLDADAEGCGDRTRTHSYPSGTSRLAMAYTWTGVQQRLDVMFVLLDEDGVVDRYGTYWQRPLDTPAGECIRSSWPSGDDPWPDGEYRVAALVGPERTIAGSSSVRVGGTGAATDQIVLSGRIVDSDTGLGVPDVWVVILKPGADGQAFLRTPARDLVVALDDTDREGRYTLSGPVTVGETYPFIVQGPGYQSLNLSLGPVKPLPTINDVRLTKVA
jgi:hypothetical protein